MAENADNQKKIKLTKKEEAFCQSYLIDFNGAKAARTAGYSVKAARETASYLLTKTNIQHRIEQLRQQMGKDFNVTRERMAQELALIAYGDTKDLLGEDGKIKPPSEWTDEGRIISSIEETTVTYGNDSQITKVTKKVKQWEKTKAMELLARLMGYNAPEKHAQTDPDGNPVDPHITVNVIYPEKGE